MSKESHFAEASCQGAAFRPVSCGKNITHLPNLGLAFRPALTYATRVKSNHPGSLASTLSVVLILPRGFVTTRRCCRQSSSSFRRLQSDEKLSGPFASMYTRCGKSILVISVILAIGGDHIPICWRRSQEIRLVRGCEKFMPGPDWLLLSKTCEPFFSPLYIPTFGI